VSIDAGYDRKQLKTIEAKSEIKPQIKRPNQLNPVQKPAREHSVGSKEGNERNSHPNPFSKNPSAATSLAKGYLSGPQATDTESARLSNV
jgi:hypothetical protein